MRGDAFSLMLCRRIGVLNVAFTSPRHAQMAPAYARHAAEAIFVLPPGDFTRRAYSRQLPGRSGAASRRHICQPRYGRAGLDHRLPGLPISDMTYEPMLARRRLSLSRQAPISIIEAAHRSSFRQIMAHAESLPSTACRSEAASPAQHFSRRASVRTIRSRRRSSRWRRCRAAGRGTAVRTATACESDISAAD